MILTMMDRTSAKPTGPGFISNLWHAVGLLFWVIVLRVLNRVRVQNSENIPRRGDYGVLICSNHISALDPFVIAVTAMPFFSPVWWRAPAKEELFAVPLIRDFLKSWGAIPVRRGRGDLGAIQAVSGYLRQGVVVIFPEGTRSPDGRLLPGKAGVGKIIYDAKPAEVIPVLIAGSERVLPKGRVLPRLFRTITIVYGRPIDLVRYYSQGDSVELSQEIVDAVMQAIDQLHSVLKHDPFG
jgi:1-acyl-sn-glycerol-3-phosphate acyltransferase